jgi:DNA/RNA endonuclease G, NUC1
MAKKKTKRTTKRKGKKKGGSTFLSDLRQVIAWSLIAVISVFGITFFNDYYIPSEEKKAMSLPEQRHSEARAELDEILHDAEIPSLVKKKAEQIIKHTGYTVSYNSDYRIANWVAYELTGEEASSNVTERSNKFVSDPKVKGASAQNQDYTRSGYDRGHMAPAGDMKWSARAMQESFYLSNICPQDPKLNKGIWKDLEEQSRVWAKKHGALYIVCGPVIDGELKRLGKNRVGIPTHFYKVICNPATNQAMGFVFENRDYRNRNLERYAIPVDSVEKVTGIDFFPTFPDKVERRMESVVEWSKW